jgi:hypothetical protein
LFGAGNTILFKYQDIQHIEGNDFNHPFMQSLSMFMGEMFCFVFFIGHVLYDR